MTGNEVYENQYNNLTNNLIANNPDKQYLSGYRFFMNNLLPSSVYRYLTHVVTFMNYNRKQPENLILDDYTQFLSSVKNETASYQIAVYAALKKFSSYLAASERSTKNPMQHIARPKFKEGQKTQAKREIGYLEKKEIKTYINAIKNGVGSSKAKATQREWKERDLCIILLLLNTGMRRSALFKLDVDNVDLEKGSLITIDKGDKIQEYVLSEDMVRCLADWLVKRREILGDVKENALFISQRKTRLSSDSIVNIVNKYAEGIKGKKITPHKLRATYGTQLYAQTGDLYFVQQCMNHSNPKTTEIYIRGQKEQSRKKAADIMAKLTQM